MSTANALDYGEITDEELVASAARILAMLDAEEDAQAMLGAGGSVEISRW